MSDLITLQKIYTTQASLLQGVRVEERQVNQVLRDSCKLSLDQVKSMRIFLESQRVLEKVEYQTLHSKIRDHFKGLMENQDSSMRELESDGGNRCSCDITEFMKHFYQQNQNKIGMCLLDEYGRFIFFDQVTRDLLEKSNEQISAMTLFDSMFPASLRKLRNKLPSRVMGFQQNCKNHIQFSVYSESNRKKTLKRIGVVKKQFMEPNNNTARRKTQKAECKFEKYQETTDELYCKYLKCLSLNMQRMQVSIHQLAIQSLQDLGIHLNKDHYNLKDLMDNKVDHVLFQAVLCELKESETFEQISKEELIKDPTIQKHEDKFIRKLQKLSNDVRQQNMRSYQ